MKVNDIIKHYQVYSILHKKEENISGICRDKILGHDRFIKYIPKKAKRNEVDNLLELDHRRIPKIIDIVEYDHGTYFLMEYIRGMSVDEYFKQVKVSFSDMLTLLIHLSMILEHVHCVSIIHGDIKLENLIIDEQCGVHLIDFGSSFTDVDSGSFTVEYVAPERLLSQYRADERSDIYSFGVLMAKMNQYLSFSYVKKYKLKKVISKCKQVNPSNRFKCASELKDALLKIR